MLYVNGFIMQDLDRGGGQEVPALDSSPKGVATVRAALMQPTATCLARPRGVTSCQPCKVSGGSAMCHSCSFHNAAEVSREVG